MRERPGENCGCMEAIQWVNGLGLSSFEVSFPVWNLETVGLLVLSKAARTLL